jgi:transposase
VGKNKHHACVHDTVEDRYTKVFPFIVNLEGFERFLLFLQRQGPAEEVLVGVEASGPYALTIGHLLLEYGYMVVELNPFQASQFRKAQGKKAKTDRVDARSMADFLAVGSYKPLALGDPPRENLRELTRFRAEELFHRLHYDRMDFPVGGIQSLASILAEIDNIHRFPTLKQFLYHFGWCPQTFQIGGFRQEHPRMSHAGNRYVRRMVWMLAIMAVKTVPAYRGYFHRRTAAGNKKMNTIVVVGRKLLSVIYAVLKTGRPYIPEGGASHLSLCPALTSI